MQFLKIPYNVQSLSERKALWASWRALVQAVTSKWQLCLTSPVNTNSSAGENGFLAKNISQPHRLGINPESSNGQNKRAVLPVFRALGAKMEHTLLVCDEEGATYILTVQVQTWFTLLIKSIK